MPRDQNDFDPLIHWRPAVNLIAHCTRVAHCSRHMLDERASVSIVPRIPVMQFLSKDTEEPEDDQQRERDSQQPKNERFSHGWPLLSRLWLTTRILSMRLRAQLFQEAG